MTLETLQGLHINGGRTLPTDIGGRSPTGAPKVRFAPKGPLPSATKSSIYINIRTSRPERSKLSFLYEATICHLVRVYIYLYEATICYLVSEQRQYYYYEATICYLVLSIYIYYTRAQIVTSYQKHKLSPRIVITVCASREATCYFYKTTRPLVGRGPFGAKRRLRLLLCRSKALLLR